ncbi:MAG: LPS assembly protein LptD [Opitutae bacterium]|nr:LPS assembly protein LptD [Opitutae bacterium]
MLSAPVRHWFCLGLVGCSLAAGAARAQPAAPEATGNKFYYDDRTKESVFTGAAKLVYGDLIITADEIRYHTADNRASAAGHFVLTSGRRRLVADRGTYNLATKMLHVENLRLGEFPVYLRGETVDGTLDEMVITNATVFLRENASYTPSLRARKLTYARGKIILAEDVALGLLGGRFIHLRHFEQKLDVQFINYLTARLGYRGSLGLFGEAGVRVPVAPGFRLGADVGLYTARGLMVGPSGNYTRVGDGDTLDGYFRSGFIRDFGDRKNDILGRPVPENRGFFEWQHQQRLGEHFALDGQFNYWRDSEILRDFRPRAFFPVQQPDSFLEGTYSTANTVLSAFARVHPNPFHRVQERLPEVRFDLLPMAAPGGFYERFNASVAVLQEDAFGTDPARRSTRLDAYYGLTRPFTPTDWFTFAPVAGGRVTYYADATGARDTFTRTIGEIGFDAQLRGSGTFDYKNPVWEIDGLRHLLTPKLSYRYAPAAGDGRAFIPPIDRSVFATYLQPLSIGDTRNIDDLHALDTLRFELANTLQTRNAGYGSRNLAQLNLAADYRFERAAGARPLSDLHTAFALTPAPWLKLEIYHRFSPQDSIQQELNTALELIDQKWWSVRLSSHFLKRDYQEYSLDYRQRFNEVFDVIGRWRYDALHSRFNEQTYGLSQRLGQTWALKYEVSFFQGPRRESSFSFNVEIELLKF